MYDSYIIETRRGAAGIVVWDGGGYRFFAATRDFSGLEGRTFDTPKQAEIAAVQHVSHRKTPQRQREGAAHVE
jgi:hypothetical protein